MLLTISLILIVAILAIMRTYDLTATEAINKSAHKLNLVAPNKRLISYSEKFSENQEAIPNNIPFPRIFLKQLQYWDGVTPPSFFNTRIKKIKQYKLNDDLDCTRNKIAEQLYCYLLNPQSGQLSLLESSLKSFEFKKPKEVGTYGNGWIFALMYDIAKATPNLHPGTKVSLDNKAAYMLDQYLNKLDGASASLWHGRSSLAANAFLLASVLDLENYTYRQLYNRAYGHFSYVYQAINATETWPEGFNYWINDRAIQMILALSAYMNMQDETKRKADILNTINRIGLWHIYLTKPNITMEGWADEGPKMDLKDETAKVIDLISQITGKKVFSDYAQIIRQKHSRESYYRGHRWMLPLFWQGELDPPTFDKKALSLTPLETELPLSELFGKNFTNHLSIRSDWSPNATFITFKAGHTFTHHQHYDAGHFTIYKGAPLAVNSSNYAGNVLSENRMYYGIRTIAKNSLLVHKENERVKPNYLFDKNIADGGQRLVLPTGSAVTSFNDWKDNFYQGKHFEGATLTNYSHQVGEYTTITADLTASYNSTRFDDSGEEGKVKRVERTLAYLEQQDYILIYDNIQTTNLDYQTKWLLHSINRPEFGDMQLQKGTEYDGILVSQSSFGKIKNLENELNINIISPAKSVTKLIGGPNYKYFIESNSEGKGSNFSTGSTNAPWFDQAEWRIEITPQNQTDNEHYLVLLQPRIAKNEQSTISPFPVNSSGVNATRLGDTVFLWESQSGTWNIESQENIKKLAIFSDKETTLTLMFKDEISNFSQKVNIGFNLLHLPQPINQLTKIYNSTGL